jgi:adenylosuccinate lyase
MQSIWNPENKYKKWLEVEILVCEAWAELGVIPLDAARHIREKATFSIDRITELEVVLRHDVLAFTTAVGETVGDVSRYIHLGLTSSDVLDTALALQMVEAADLILEGLGTLDAAIFEKMESHRRTAMVGRSHGIHAEPITAGLKFAVWLSAIRRNRERIKIARESARVGKISGAVGTYANVDPRVEAFVCGRLGLKAMDISTQIIPRDIHAEFMSALALAASTLDMIATEIRSLQRTEIREMEEPFVSGQKGSSAMPHKQNPITCEQITGLSRVIKHNASAALDNIVLWHERDISHSSVERVILPDSTILLDYLIHKTFQVVKGLRIYPEHMERNLNLTGGLIYSQHLLLSLIEKGISREEAYAWVQQYALRAWESGENFKDMVSRDIRFTQILPELDTCFDLDYHMKYVDTIIDRFKQS